MSRPFHSFSVVLALGLAAFAMQHRVSAATADTFEVDNDNAADITFAGARDPLTVISASTRALASAVPMRTIANGQTQVHTLHVGGTFAGGADRDVVRFVLTQPSDIIVQTDEDIGFADTVLRVYNGMGTQIGFNDDIDVNNDIFTSRIQLNGLNGAGPGTVYFVSVEDFGLRGGTATTIDSYKITLLVTPAGSSFSPVITSAPRALAVAGAPFKYNISAIGTQPITLTATGLPTGVVVTGSTISGVPIVAGQFTVTLTAVNAAGTTTLSLIIDVVDFGIMTTVAGTGNFGSSGDNDFATLAEFKEPRGITAGPGGHLFISDTFSNRIRKVDVVTGLVTTVVGGGNPDPIGDNGPATSAILGDPFSVALDSAGNVYIADFGGNRIRKVTATTGIITTIAGNGDATFAGDGTQAINASLSGPNAVAVDSAGNVYIADTGNQRIRRIGTNGIIQTVAGTGVQGFSAGPLATNAALNNPFDIAVDSAGNVYIAEGGNHIVRKITNPGAAGTIAIFAGTAMTAGNTGNGGPATSARLNLPAGLAINTAGDVFISDSNNGAVRKVTGGTITAVVGGLSFPLGLSVDSAGTLYIADNGVNQVLKFVGATLSAFAGTGVAGFAGDGGLATAALLSGPTAVAAGEGGTVFICDEINLRIRRVLSTGVISTFAGGGFPGEGAVATAATLGQPNGNVGFDSAGNMYISDTFNHRVRRVAATTNIITTIAGNGAAGLTPDGSAALNNPINTPVAIVVDAANNVYFSDAANNRIRRIAAGTGILTTVAGDGTAAVLSVPLGIALDPPGTSLFIADTGNHRIRRVTLSIGAASITTVAGTGVNGFAGDGGPATAALFSFPGDVRIDGMDMLICDTNNNRVRRVDGSGRINTLAGNGVAEFSGDGQAAFLAGIQGARAIAQDATRSLFICDSLNNRIRKVGVAAKPVITNNPLTATGTVNQFFTYRLSATGHPAPSFSVTGLPAGLVALGSGLITGVPTSSGATDVTVAAINGPGIDTRTLRIVISNGLGAANAAPAFPTDSSTEVTIFPNPGVINKDMTFIGTANATDADDTLRSYQWDFGDGTSKVGSTVTKQYAAAGLYTVKFTATDGTATSAPITSIAAVNASSATDNMNITKASLKFTFGSTNKDTVSISGTIPVTTGTAAKVYFLKGSQNIVERSVTIGAKGSDTFKLSKGKFTFTMSKQTLSTEFAVLGFLPNTTKTIQVPILISIDSQSYVATITISFKSSAKSGSGKKTSEQIGGR